MADDYKNDTQSTAAISVGAQRAGRIETNGDSDWFKVNLADGVTYRIDLLGEPSGRGSLSYPVLEIYDSRGTLIGSNTDGGLILDTGIAFTTFIPGTYYIGASAFGNEGSGSYLVKFGLVGPPIRGTGGNDVLVGTYKSEDIYGLDGNDVLSGKGGNDDLMGGTGIDTVTYASVSTSGVAVNLSLGVANSNDGPDRLGGIENVVGTQFGDTLKGDSGANRLSGLGSNDDLIGQSGNDVLSGGTGNDRLTGGNGRDGLSGGQGSDVFHFDVVADSGLGAANRDHVTDFNPGDKIDVRAIDANSAVDGNQAFVWKGAGALTGAGQAHHVTVGGAHLLQFSTDGDAAPEFEIQIPTGFNPVAGDLIL